MLSFPTFSLSRVYPPGASFITACCAWCPMQVTTHTSGKNLAHRVLYLTEFSFNTGCNLYLYLKGSKTMTVPLLATGWEKGAGVQDGARAAIVWANTFAGVRKGFPQSTLHMSGQSGVSAVAPIKPSFGVDEAVDATTGRWKTGAHQAVMTARIETVPQSVLAAWSLWREFGCLSLSNTMTLSRFLQNQSPWWWYCQMSHHSWSRQERPVTPCSVQKVCGPRITNLSVPEQLQPKASVSGKATPQPP